VTLLLCRESRPPAQSTILRFGSRVPFHRVEFLSSELPSDKNKCLALLLLQRGTHLSSTVVLCFHQCVWKSLQHCTGASATSMLYFSEAQQIWNILPYWGKSCLGLLLWHFPSGLLTLCSKGLHRVINYITRNQYDLSKIHLWPRIAPCYCQLISGGIR